MVLAQNKVVTKAKVTSSSSATGGSQAKTQSLCLRRLNVERENWLKDHPHAFVARPYKSPDGTHNMLTWECLIPGKPKTEWEGGFYRVVLTFNDDYPHTPPMCRFVPAICHPNVYPSGKICLSIIQHDWKPTLTVKQVLIGIQEMLANPNLSSPAQSEAFNLITRNKADYMKRTRDYAKTKSSPLMAKNLPIDNGRGK